MWPEEAALPYIFLFFDDHELLKFSCVFCYLCFPLPDYSPAPEDLELIRRMNELGLPLAFQTSKEVISCSSLRLLLRRILDAITQNPIMLLCLVVVSLCYQLLR